MPKQDPNIGQKWYVLHTYSGYEENVKRNLEQRVESMNMQDFIFDVLIPTETKIKIKNGKRKTVREKIFPGYVLVNMVVTDASWYVARNTPNVTGFIGLGTTPTPVDPAEMGVIERRDSKDQPKFNVDVEVGEMIKIVDGPFKDYDSKIESMDIDRGKVSVLVNIFGRETPVELDFLQIKKI